MRRHPPAGLLATERDRRTNVSETPKDEAPRQRALGGPRLPGYAVGAGRLPDAPGETAVGYGLLDKLGLRVGDATTVDISGVEHHVRVVG